MLICFFYFSHSFVRCFIITGQIAQSSQRRQQHGHSNGASAIVADKPEQVSNFHFKYPSSHSLQYRPPYPPKNSTSAYSIRAVAETLGNLLKQGLHYQPQHLAWLRLGGEYEFVSDNNESAMAHYVGVLLIGTEYCTLHVQQRQLLDDHMTRRMIKASLNLGCNIQAAILCQLLEEMDYALAFKCIAERTTFKNISDKSAHYCECNGRVLRLCLGCNVTGVHNPAALPER